MGRSSDMAHRISDIGLPSTGRLPLAARVPLAARAGLGAVAAAGALFLGACSGSESGEFSGELVIRSCSIGCTDGQGGAQVSCAIVNVTENQEISVLFSEPIDPTSINSISLQVTDADNGTSPEGLRFVDPLDPRRVVFRPSIAFESGATSFSFGRNRSYQVLIPGVRQGDPGPFLRSTAGRPNQSRLQCSIRTTEGIADITPGNPQVLVEVDRVTSYNANGDPVGFARTALTPDPTNPVTDISRDSLVYFLFNELMFIPTIADNATGSAPFIRVQLDTDGNLATQGGDRVPVPGTYQFEVDQVSLTTRLTFTPQGQIPSAGADPNNPKLLVVSIPPNVTDIAGNPVTGQTGGGLLVGIPERVLFDDLVLPVAGGETFDDDARENPVSSGQGWADNGILAVGLTGGSGRLGELVVADNQTIVLDTDSQSFPLNQSIQVDVIGNPVGGVAGYPRSITVTGGVFEFSRVSLGAGSTLRFTGSNVPRLLCRGEFRQGSGALIDLAGASAPATHDSTTLDVISVATPAEPGVGGGEGGLGADRSDPSASLQSALFISGNPGAIRDGSSGGGPGGGTGAAGFPASLITIVNINGPATPGLNDTAFNFVANPIGSLGIIGCFVKQLAGPGGGGGYSTPGGAGSVAPVGAEVQTEFPPGRPLTPATTAGGVGGAGLGLQPPSVNNVNYNRRILRWENGHLVGGSGGGGGGNHIFGTESSNFLNPSDCDGDSSFAARISSWADHSAASGGAGGGALGILAGRRIDADGRFNLTGGDGGSALADFSTAGGFATPGGGASGGGLRLRSPIVDLGLTSLIDVSGGVGGSAPWSLFNMNQQVRGGGGAAGLVRIEDAALTPATTIEFNTIAPRVRPFNSFMPLDSANHLSVAPGYLDASTVGTLRPDSLTGVTSCWIQPQGNFLQLLFPADSGPELENQGWTMDVVLDDGAGGTTTRPFRGTTAVGMHPTGWEAQFGNLLGYDLQFPETASPIVVRFQGARARVLALNDPCDVDINDAFGEVIPNSVTPWVAHPNDLNLVTDPSGSTFAINMIRYCVIFDKTIQLGDTPGTILASQGVLGVDNVSINVTPD